MGYLYGLNSSVWIDFLGLTGARVTWTRPNVPGGTITGLSTVEGGNGITHPVVQEVYDNAPLINVLILVCMVDVLKQRLSVKGQKRQMLPIWKSLENK